MAFGCPVRICKPEHTAEDETGVSHLHHNCYNTVKDIICYSPFQGLLGNYRFAPTCFVYKTCLYQWKHRENPII